MQKIILYQKILLQVKNLPVESHYRKTVQSIYENNLNVVKNETDTEIIIDKLNQLLLHHYSSRQQSEYLKQCKNVLEGNPAIILLDFIENYSFVVQDQVQSNYWTKQSCTLHPVVIYYKNQVQILQTKSLCCFTEDLKHDVAAVHKFSEKILSYVRTHLPLFNHFQIFSNGCADNTKIVKIFYTSVN